MVNQDKRFIGKLTRTFVTKTSNGPKMMFGIEDTKNCNDTFRLDQVNGDRWWQEVINTELDQIMGHNTFKNYGMNSSPPKDFKKVPLHFVFSLSSLIQGGW